VSPQGFIADLDSILLQSLSHIFRTGCQPQKFGKVRFFINQLLDCCECCINGCSMVGMGLK